jgi:hypothetical protein
MRWCTCACNRIAKGTTHPGITRATTAPLDATVPNWRFTVSGSANIEAELSRWFADPGRFEELTVTRLPRWGAAPQAEMAEAAADG